MTCKYLIIVPARAGSKGVPFKNSKLLGDKPLIAWSLDVAVEFSDVTDLIVTTDDLSIIDYCNQRSISYIKRPDFLSSDSAKMVDVINHVLNSVEVNLYKGFILLQPTCPFRKAKTIEKTISYLDAGEKSIIGMLKCNDSHPARMYKYKDNGELECLDSKYENNNRQDLPLVLKRSGVVYAVDVDRFKQQQSFFYKDSKVVYNDSYESINIDEPIDFDFAELLVSRNENT